ncbi:hypothetical protein O3G_MSEX012619 [Manduca sexta]|uniref:Ketosynthase family 3 (KS3) domain-containing protein n=1 Tax=Manduca sexta TaxID=7130 RepID=A0A922CWX0_MANSE|nr:hypothetical protein O3G_MSEX012619 [Manduca sexta]
MFANRISYWLNAKGASVAVNASGSSGLLSLEQAYMDLMSGRCDAAIVGASHMTFYAHFSIHYGRVVPLSPDGKTRAFDQNANGLGMSDATIVLFLQKAKDALRVYGELVNVNNQFIQTERVGESDFGFYRNPATTIKFLKSFYDKTEISPDDVEYIEAFGTGVPELDKAELESIDQFFCQKRTNPLLVGSVMSNLGYTEASAGLIAITKVLLGFENGKLAGNLHCTSPRQDVSAIRDGRISIVSEHTDFNRSYAAVNDHSYTDTKDNKTVSLYEKAERVDTSKPPLWFVYSGMGSQWVGMGTQLMRIPIFAAAVERCHQILAPRGVDIVNIITTTDENIFNNILNSFLGIAVIQIGLTDILRHLGIVPDYIIGHSVGELGCGYADGCLTEEEMILAAFSRGKVSLDTPLIKGSMAAVGLGYEQIRPLCPPEIDVACHNGPESCTISGPADAMTKFVAKLTEKGIFAKEVPCSEIAYHSRYIAEAGPGLKKYLLEVIKNPKPRSDKWVSTSVPQSKWNEPEAKYCSAEYHTNNLLNPVLFEETSRLIPADAVLVEVAPHGLLQPILKRSLPSTCRHVALTNRRQKDNVMVLLDAVGQLYMEGFLPNVQALYPKVEFPVSPGTPMLSHLVEWSHIEEWELPSYLTKDRRHTAACEYMISVHDDEYKYTQGNISNKVSTVATGYINLYAGNSATESDDKKYEDYEHKSEEIYEVLKARDYAYSGEFRSIHNIDTSLTKANVKWNDNWAAHIDGMLQLNALRRTYDGISQPSFIRKLVIDVDTHKKKTINIGESTVINAEISDVHDYTRCGGIIMHNLRFRDLPRDNEYKFKLLAPAQDGNMKEIDYLSMDTNDANASHITLQSEIRGDLNSLQWVKTSEPTGPGVKVTVHYAGLNNRDVKEATGTLAQQFSHNSYGMDFSGVTESGTRVMGVVSGGACSSEVRAAPELLWPVPEHWTLEDAATVPLAYAHAFYCLCVKADSLMNKTVLVHGGTGALGQAAIAIALAHGCEVFATVGDLKKAHFLRKLYPALKEDHIGNSRDSSFGDMVLYATKGRGCDIIISSVDAELKDISLKCAGFNGVTFDTVQVLNQESYQYGMFHMTKQRSYIALDFSSIFDTQNYAERTVIFSRLKK